MVKDRYNIERRNDSDIESDKGKRSVTKTIEEVGEEFQKFRKGVRQGMSYARTVRDEVDGGFESLGQFIWGSNPPPGASSRKQEHKEKQYSKREVHDDREENYRKPSQKQAVRDEYVVLTITKSEIDRVLRDNDIDPMSLPNKFYQDVANRFASLLSSGLAPYRESKLAEVVHIIDQEYTNRYGRND